MNDLTGMQSNFMFNQSQGDSHPQITRNTDPAGFKEMIREQMDAAKNNQEKMSEQFGIEKQSLELENEYLNEKINKLSHT